MPLREMRGEGRGAGSEEDRERRMGEEEEWRRLMRLGQGGRQGGKEGLRGGHYGASATADDGGKTVCMSYQPTFTHIN